MTTLCIACSWPKNYGIDWRLLLVPHDFYFKQTYKKVKAEVDPLIVASLNDIDLCIDQLKVLFGVDVHFNDDNGSFYLEGNLMQLQCAQTYLDDIFDRRQVR